MRFELSLISNDTISFRRRKQQQNKKYCLYSQESRQDRPQGMKKLNTFKNLGLIAACGLRLFFKKTVCG